MTSAFLPLATFALAATFSPGGATSLAASSGAQFGYLRSLPLIFGIAVALAALVAASGTGLAAVILAVPALAVAMKFAGTAYLLFLAVMILRAGAPDKASLAQAEPIGFFGGVLLLAINPKAWAMSMGVAGSFSDISDDPVVLAGTLGGVFFVAAASALTTWAVAGSLLARLLRTEFQWHLVNFVLASLLVLSIVSFWM